MRTVNCIFVKNSVCECNGSRKGKACIEIVNLSSNCLEKIEHKKPAPPPAPPKPRR